MRCACPECGCFMIHAESAAACVCPECLHRCSACLGDGTPLTHDSVMTMKHINHTEDGRSDEQQER